MDEDPQSDLSFLEELLNNPSVLHPDEARFDLTVNDLTIIPEHFLEAQCSKLYIEFLTNINGNDLELLDTDDEVNTHASLKVDFVEPVGEYMGFKATMELELAGARPRDGSLIVKLLPYFGTSISSIRSFSFGLRGSVTMLQIIDAMTSESLEHFRFGFDPDGDFCGCRDFTVQAIYQLRVRGYVDPGVQAVYSREPEIRDGLTAYDVLAMRFSYGGRPFECPVDKGEFLIYERVEEPYMKYRADDD
ncbi:hypothetical protein F4811DRAFT_549630 [Daldinia bambusicola]|nr:hypothetical protein F4811DRAFT_549630 [Daldinia bambusicola]